MAVCLRPAPGSPELLFILRTEDENDPWSGQVALPGGRRDPGDASLWETAERETMEETGVDLGSAAERLGRLDDVHPRTRVLPSIAISPFVFAVPAGTRAHVGPEVQDVMWIPLADLMRPDRQTRIEVGSPGAPKAYPSIRHGRYEIWGLTHRILTQLFELVGEAA